MSLASLMLIASSPLWGTLEPGPFKAGYRIAVYEDASRLDGPKRGPFADQGGPQPRRLSVHLWYPAPPGTAEPGLTLGDYAALNGLDRPPDGPVPAADRRAGESALRSLVQGRHRALTDEEWEALRSARAAGVYEAPAALGRFPLLIGTLRVVSNAITAEYLASHGYVVAFVKTESAFAGTPWEMEVPLRDMEVVAERLRGEPVVDPTRTGTIGFSGSGFSQVLLAMRNAHVDALVDIESAIFVKGFNERLAATAAYRPDALQAAFLHIYGRELAANPRVPEDKIQDFRDMRYSERIRLILDQPGLDHWDVATEGMATATVLSIRGDKAAGVRRTFEAANLYTLRFLDAHVKGDSAAQAWLRASPESHSLGGIVSVEALPAAPPVPTPADLERLGRTRGGAAVVEALKQARAADPGAAVLAEADLNRLGYRLLARGQPAFAVEVLALAAEKYPSSANTQDSLAEALEAAGRPADAIAASRRALELLDARPAAAPGGADTVRRSSQERLRRLEKP